VKRPTRRL